MYARFKGTGRTTYASRTTHNYKDRPMWGFGTIGLTHRVWATITTHGQRERRELRGRGRLSGVECQEKAPAGLRRTGTETDLSRWPLCPDEMASRGEVDS